LALLRDFAEEGWPSMDLCADMLGRRLSSMERERLVIEPWCPEFRRRGQRIPWFGRSRLAVNADRAWNRFVVYPRYLRCRRNDADLFHVADHSYAHLVHELPAERTGVFCHDLDAFRCLLEPVQERRPLWFRKMARRILSGLEKAAIVFHTTRVVGDELVARGIVDRARLVLAPLGVAPEFYPDAVDPEFMAFRRVNGDRPYVLHVGNCIPRKRIDVLLATFARLTMNEPRMLLVKVGGSWTASQQELIERHGLCDRIIHVTNVSLNLLATFYRHAACVVVSSEAEGFGLPVLEGLACGASVIGSDLSVFREVAGDAIRYAPIGNVDAFVSQAVDALVERRSEEIVAKRVRRSQRFSWEQHAQIVGDAYRRLMS
jgi:glycosyltransferase involved in cell wall biosynthesis